MDPKLDPSSPLVYAPPEDLREGAVVIRHDRKMAVAGLLVGLLGIGIALYSRLYLGFLNEWWFFIFGGLFVALGLYGLFDSRPKLILDSKSFIDRKTNLGEIWWDQVADVRTAIFNHWPHLYVRLHDPDLAQAKWKQLGKWKGPARPSDARADEIVIPLIGIAVEPERLVAMMNERRAAAEPSSHQRPENGG